MFMSWHWTTLRQWLKTYPNTTPAGQPSLPPAMVAALMMELCNAIEFLHSRSFIHRAITVRAMAHHF